MIRRDQLFTLVQKPRGVYHVMVAGIEVAQIERAPDLCWSYAPWRIIGDTQKVGPAGSAGGKYKKKLRGWGNRKAAAHFAAIMNSSIAIKALCAMDSTHAST